MYLGFGAPPSFLNHSDKPNASTITDKENIYIKIDQDVEKNEEIFILYNGNVANDVNEELQ